MADANSCPECGAASSELLPLALCPRCAFRGALEISDGDVEGTAPLTSSGATSKSIQSSLKPGDWIGRYKLIEEFGEGGCGTVFMAEQVDPVRRTVALKVIKLGMDTRSVIARFEAERQVLALMDHPNIAKILDGGATVTGRPYFVMELVPGVPITTYCDQHHLPTAARIDLFVQVCQAIQHAHHKGIIHRDLKPSNVLVMLQDGVPVPKVIDFGIAKVTTGQQLTDNTLFTAFEQFIGTPAYMSPEQVDTSGIDIDTRTDIYSLGVLLYELLTGKTPFDKKELLAAGLEEMRRTIREREPVRPSTRLNTMILSDLTKVAHRRQTEPGKLTTQLRGDLDWIVMKALEKDRARRYDTANGLASDLRRHLSNEPVLARPPSSAYRLQKLVRRNKLAVVAGTAVFAALILGTVVSSRQAALARHNGTLALQSRGEAEKLSNFILDDLYSELEPTGQFEIIARLAAQAVSYYDNLPNSLHTPETIRHRALAQARGALAHARQGDYRTALPMAERAIAALEATGPQSNRNEPTAFALGVAWEAYYWCFDVQFDTTGATAAAQRGVDVLRPVASSAQASRQTRLQYARLLNALSHTQPTEQAVATCQEATKVLEDLGALSLSDLGAASAWAQIADSEARELLALGTIDRAEAIEKQVRTMAEGVLERRPGDLRARLSLCLALEALSWIEARRYRYNAALDFARQASQAGENYLRFNPSDATGRGTRFRVDLATARLLFSQGRVSEALHHARMTVEGEGNETGLPGFLLNRQRLQVALWEAQSGRRELADRWLQDARRIYAAFAERSGNAAKHPADLLEYHDIAQRRVHLAFGEAALALGLAKAALIRVEKARTNFTDRIIRERFSLYQREALCDIARAGLRLGNFQDGEEAARALLSLPDERGDIIRRFLLDEPADGKWATVFLAQSLVGQGRLEEAREAISPVVMHLRHAQAQGATDVVFRQKLARAIGVQALAQPASPEGAALRRLGLQQAAAVLQELPEEALQLRDTKELLSWITAAP